MSCIPRSLALWAFPFFLAGHAVAQDAAERPNIVFLFSDDHAAHTIGAYMEPLDSWLAEANERDPLTPNIDRIAADGALGVNVFCGNSICGPSRATVITGAHSHINGFRANEGKQPPFDMNQWSFPAELRRHGYRTAMFGKLHLNQSPSDQMFDDWEIYPGQGNYLNPDYITAEGREQRHGYSVDLTGDLGLNWMRQNTPEQTGKPFFLAIQFKAPHRNFLPPAEQLDRWGPELLKDAQGNWSFNEALPMPPTLFMDLAERSPSATSNEMSVADYFVTGYDDFLFPRDTPRAKLPTNLNRGDEEQVQPYVASYNARNDLFRAAREDGFITPGDQTTRWKEQRYLRQYLGTTAGVDTEVGLVLDQLEELGLSENTIVIYASDQGFYMGDYGLFDKRWAWEISMRMPFIISWPGHIEAGSQMAQQMQNIDFAPTLLDFAGIPKDKWQDNEKVQGLSFAGAFTEGEQIDRDSIYYNYYEGTAHSHAVPRHEAVRTANWKLLRIYEAPKGIDLPEEGVFWELYDLSEDPHELHNLAGDPNHAKIEAQLKDELVRLRKVYQVPEEDWQPIRH